MDVQDSLDLRVEQISIAVDVQLQLTIQPGLQNVDVNPGSSRLVARITPTFVGCIRFA